MRIGVIGVGHLAATLLEGWRRAGLGADSVLLSPRGRARELAAAQGYAVAGDNADLVRRADVVLLAVRPADVQTALAGLPWRAGQVLLSACAGVPIPVLEAAAPGAQVCRIMPLTAAGIGASPIPCLPMLDSLRPLLECLGPVIPLAHEADFEAATVSAAVYGWALSLIGTSIGWAVANGLPPETARQLTGATFAAAGRMACEPGADMAAMLSELVTPGGITERGLQVLEAGQVAQSWRAASDAVLEKLTG